MKVLFFDTETTGLPKNRESARNGPGNWPHMVSISWVLQDNGKTIESQTFIVKPKWQIPEDSIKIHGITQERAWRDGKPLLDIIGSFLHTCSKADWTIGHNIDFDLNVIINACLWDLNISYPTFGRTFCTMENSKDLCKIAYGNGRSGYKPPKLSELYEFVFKKKPIVELLHSSSYDTQLLVDIVREFRPFKVMIGLPIEDESIVNASNKRTETLQL
jgi:DNA polymerase III epsilon subunit-like protein